MLRVVLVCAGLLAAAPGWGAGMGLLTSEQQAVLGCGEFYGTECDLDSVSLLDDGARALLESFPRLSGTAFPAQPGSGVLPGARGPSGAISDPRFEPSLGLVFQPFTDEPFASEQAALSWNYLMLLAATSAPLQPGSGPLIDSFDAAQPFRLDGCSFARPQDCRAVQQALAPAAAIPEPGAALLFALGAVLLRAARRL